MVIELVMIGVGLELKEFWELDGRSEAANGIDGLRLLIFELNFICKVFCIILEAFVKLVVEIGVILEKWSIGFVYTLDLLTSRLISIESL